MRTAIFYLAANMLAFFLLQPLYAQSETPAPTPAAVTAEADLIHYGDVIDIDVVGSLEFDWRGTLNPEGFLDGFDKIPEQVNALCKSEEDLAEEIAKEYAKILRQPNVVVKILDRSNRPVSVLQGAVRTPQRFQIKRPVFLNELLIVAGGLNERANGEIKIFRSKNLNCFSTLEKAAAKNGETREKFIPVSQGNGSETLNIRVVDLLKGIREANPEVLSGDIITVEEAAPIYVIGGVRSPKQISSRSQTTLSRAIASAGGLSKEGTEKVIIFRRDSGGSQVINADLDRIRNGQDKDIELKAHDVVDVGQKGREARKTSPVSETGAETNPPVLPLRIIE